MDSASHRFDAASATQESGERHNKRKKEGGEKENNQNLWGGAHVAPKATRPRACLNARPHASSTSGMGQMWARRGEVCIWLGLAVLSMVWTYRAHDAHKHTLVRQIRPGQRIRWAAHYLASSCDAQGKFRYLARANGMHHPEAHSYDLTHHAWVVSSLAQYCLYEGSGADTHSAAHLNDVPLDVSDVLLRSATYLVTHLRPASESEGSTSLSPSSLSKTMAEAVALWKPRTDGSVEAHCHGAAMALSALVLADRAVGGGVVDLRLLRSLGTFVVEMQQRNGLFYHTAVVHPHRDLSKAAPAAVFEGQTSHGGLASFALLLLADLDREHIDTYRMPGSSWLKPAVRALMGTALEDERMRHYKVQFRTPSHHWYAIAAAEMLRHDAPYLNRSTLPDWYVFSDHFGSVEWSVHDIRTRVTQHTARLLQGMLTHYELLPRQHHEEVFELHGALTSNGEAFLTAQRLRSMHAGLCMLPQRRQEHTDISPPDRDVQREHEMLRERLERAAKKAAAYLSSLQITYPDNPAFGGFSRARVQMHQHISERADDFNGRINEVRMDTVGDVLVALIGNRKLLLAQAAHHNLRHHHLAAH